MLAFVDNLTLIILVIMVVLTLAFYTISVIAMIVTFFANLKKSEPLKAWTVGSTLVIILLAALRTWV
jgi:hypothetical protein